MSTTDNRISWEAAAEVAASFISLIADLSDIRPLRVFGELRQRLPVVRVGIAIYTANTQAVAARLAKLVADGVCEKRGGVLVFGGLPFYLLIVTR